MQFGSTGFAEELWEECAAKIQRDPFGLTIGMGDYSDWWRPTNQLKIDLATAGDGDFKASLDTLYRTHNQKVFEKLAPIIKKGRCLGLLSGHHEYTYASGITSTQELCEKLGVPYLHKTAYIRLVFGNAQKRLKDNHGSCRAWTMLIHAQHGDGGASFVHSDMPNLASKTAPFWEADLFLRGHSTKKWHASYPVIKMTESNEPRLYETHKHMVNTGGFMRGYIQGEDTYVSKKNMPPAALGYVVVHLALRRHNTSTEMKKEQEIQISVTY